MESSGSGTGDDMDGERLEARSLGRSGRETREDMDGERLEVPSLGERVVLFGGIGGLHWGFGYNPGLPLVSMLKDGALRLGLGQRKAGLVGSLRAVGLKWHWVLMAESGLLRKKVRLLSSA